MHSIGAIDATKQVTADAAEVSADIPAYALSCRPTVFDGVDEMNSAKDARHPRFTRCLRKALEASGDGT